MKPHRDTIFEIAAEILSHEHLQGDQAIIRLAARECAEKAKPGAFVHLQCDHSLPLRRPISIMRTSPEQGWIELLYKIVGQGTRRLSQRQPGELLNLMGPIGSPFELHPERSKPLLIGGGVGMPPMVFIAQSIASQKHYSPFAIFGSEVPFPFTAAPSQIIIPGMPDGVIASMPLLEDWGIANRLTSLRGYAGCHEGYVTDLAHLWLQQLDEASLQQVEIFSCGPHPMLEAVAQVAKEFDLPCQVSLEEFMACGVGGCAGCVVPVKSDQGEAMKRVCVDGPVFQANQIF